MGSVHLAALGSAESARLVAVVEPVAVDRAAAWGVPVVESIEQLAVERLARNQWDAEPPSADFEAHSGGIVVDMGVHEIDQLRWLTAREVDDVAAVAAPDGSAAAVALRFGPTLGVITLGRRFPEPDSCW